MVGKPKNFIWLAKAALNMRENTDAKVVIMQNVKIRTTIINIMSIVSFHNYLKK